MNSQLGSASARVPKSTARAAAGESHPFRATTVTVLLLAVWIGLIAGFLDLGLLVFERRVITGHFYRLGSDFVWIIPVAVTVLILVVATVLILIARIRRAPLRLGVAVGFLSFVAFFDVCARLPMGMWPSLLLCAGLTAELTRLVVRRHREFLRVVRRTLPLLAGAILTIMLAAFGGRAWSEHRAISAVPPSAPGAQNVLLIVWDTVRAANLSLHGHDRPTSPNLERLAGRGVRFDLAFSTSSWTLPAHASLFTGRWPHELGVDWKAPLRDDVPTLAGYLGAHGYDTAGFAANLDFCGRETGLARGFAHYEDFPLDVYDMFTRYLALGYRLDIPEWVGAFASLAERHTGLLFYDWIPRSREHVKNAEAVDRAFLKWLAARQARRRPFRLPELQ